jgi:hypothetical protein
MEVALIVGGASIALAMALVAAVVSRQDAGSRRDPPPSADALREQLRSAVETAAGGKVARVEPYTDFTHEEADSGLRFVVGGLCLPVSAWRTANRGSGGIGDPEFDGLVEFSGPPDVVLALLDAETRAAVRNLLYGSVRITRFLIEQGELTAHVPTMGFARAHPGLGQVAQSLGALSRHFETPRDVVSRLAHNVERDPQPGVRLANLDALIAEHGQDPRTRSVLRTAFQDSDQRVRLRAGLTAGVEGHPVLVALALDPGTEDDHAAQAVEGLGHALPLDQIAPLVRAAALATHTGRAATTRALIALLGRRPEDDAFRWLQELTRTADDSFGPQVVEALTAGPRPGAEAVLIQLLEDWRTDRPLFVESAARRLGAIGTAAAVLPLKEAAARHGRTVASAARQAIAEIQERLAGTPGELSLSAEEDGRISMAEDASGRVSLPAKPARSED